MGPILQFLLPFTLLQAGVAGSFSRISLPLIKTIPIHIPIPETPSTEADCTYCEISDCVTAWVWVPDIHVEYPGAYKAVRRRKVSYEEVEEVEVYTAYTIVTMVATDSKSTKTSISFNTMPAPPGFTQPPINAAGTRTAAATYNDGTNIVTAELAYPTPFYRLHDSYKLSGAHTTVNETGQMECVDFDVTVPVDPNSPINGSIMKKKVDPNDPLGWGYKLVSTEECVLGFYEMMATPPVVPEIPGSLLPKCKAKTDNTLEPTHENPVYGTCCNHTGARFKRWRVRGG